MKKETITELLLNGNSSSQYEFAKSCNDEEALYLFAYNYNWGDGFSIPTAIINNSNCTLNLALMIFYAGDGYSYLLEKPEESESKEWFKFITDLYMRIKGNTFKIGKVAFNVPLTKVQVFKLKKQLAENEQIFTNQIDGIDCNIDL